jgi:hypothetical protein
VDNEKQGRQKLVGLDRLRNEQASWERLVCVGLFDVLSFQEPSVCVRSENSIVGLFQAHVRVDLLDALANRGSIALLFGFCGIIIQPNDVFDTVCKVYERK